MYKNKENMILRDFLATDRTILANERTFLAYVRTALSIIVAGASFIKFFDIKLINTLGYSFIPFGFIILIVGLIKFINNQRILSNISFHNDNN